MTSKSKPQIKVVGLGPAGPEFITSNVLALIDSSQHVYLRTNRHPSIIALSKSVESFDHVYEQCDNIADVYARIVDELVARAGQYDDVIYAVPGSPLVAEASVQRLRNDSRVETQLIPAMSFLDLVWSALQIDPLSMSPRIVDAHGFSTEAAGERGPMLIAQCDSQNVLSNIKLAFEDEPPEHAVVLQHLGLETERVETIEWEDLDRIDDIDHLTSVWIPAVRTPVAMQLARVDQVARELRVGCPWDREQTHASLSRYLIEESYELLDVIHDLKNAPDPLQHDDDLIEELGDVLFQVFAHCAIAAEQGRFNIADVSKQVTDKLIERHPHVYGDVVAETSSDVMSTWESNKKKAKGRESIMQGIPRQLPALLYAWKILKKAAHCDIEINANDIEDTGMGGALLIMVNEARRRNTDPESALREAANKIRTRFERAEQLARADGFDLAETEPVLSRKYWQIAGEQLVNETDSNEGEQTGA